MHCLVVSAWLSLSLHHLARDERCEKRLPEVLPDQTHVPEKAFVPFMVPVSFPGKKQKKPETLFI